MLVAQQGNETVSLAKLRSILPESPPASVGSRSAEHIEPSGSDQALLARLVAGDHWAQEALYRRYVRLVWSTALRLMSSTADAEDVVQDTFTEALRDAKALRQGESLRPWLVQITVHQAHRRFRKRALLRRLGLDRSFDDATLAELVHPGAPAEVHAELRRVDRALAGLPADERFAWILRHVEGYGLDEVAAALGCSLATVKRRIGRATARVESHFEEARHD
jgi:RNA polymerase sigma-70 factor (ECF subfamily)